MRSREDFYSKIAWIVNGDRRGADGRSQTLDRSYFNMGRSSHPIRLDPLAFPVEWLGKSKLLHNWSKATAAVYFDFGDGILWRFDSFEPNKTIFLEDPNPASTNANTQGELFAASETVGKKQRKINLGVFTPIRIDDFIEATASARTNAKHLRLDQLMAVLEPGDRLVVSELSRLGRSLGEVVALLDAIAKASVAFVAVKENIRFESRQDLQTKVMTTLFAEVERDLISERTREGLAKARSSGKKLGRPKGSLGVSRLDGREDESRHFLNLGVSKSSIAKITGVTRPTLYNFIATRGLKAGAWNFYTNVVGTLTWKMASNGPCAASAEPARNPPRLKAGSARNSNTWSTKTRRLPPSKSGKPSRVRTVKGKSG